MVLPVAASGGSLNDALIRLALSKTNMAHDTAMPTPIAIARSETSVTTVTSKMTRASARRIFCWLLTSEKHARRNFSGMAANNMSFKDRHSKVWTTTLNMTPTSADVGIMLIAGYATMTTSSKTTPATADDRRVR